MSDANDASPPVAWPRLVGGHPALDLANTALATHGPAGDALGDVDSFLAWAAHAGILASGAGSRPASPPSGGLERARALRGSVLTIGSARAAGAAPDGHALRSVHDLYAVAVQEAAPAFTTTLEMTWSHLPAADATVHRLTTQAVDLLRGPLDRLKACGECAFLFIDGSKNHSRRWCAMEDCGTQYKMRRYVAKRAAARGP